MGAKSTKKKAEKKNMPKRRRISFKCEASEAKRVHVAGDFNQWSETSHPMKLDDDGIWSKVMMLPLGSYQYKFIVDGIWLNDPKNEDACENEFGTLNSKITVC